MDKLKETEFIHDLSGHVFLTHFQAFETLRQ